MTVDAQIDVILILSLYGSVWAEWRMERLKILEILIETTSNRI